MSDEGLAGLVRRAARDAGRQLEAARRAYREGREETTDAADDTERVRIVCRRHAERRTVRVEDGVPACYDSDHPDCRGCAEDLQEGTIETW